MPRPKILTEQRQLELAFESKLLRTICENEAYAECQLGPTVAGGLKRRLADLRAATSFFDLVAGRPRLSDEVDSQGIVVDLGENHRIVLRANHPSNPLTETGTLDWAKISRIKVLRIETDDDQQPRILS